MRPAAGAATPPDSQRGSAGERGGVNGETIARQRKGSYMLRLSFFLLKFICILPPTFFFFFCLYMILGDTFGEFYFTPTFVVVFHMCISACSVRAVAFENRSVSVSRKKINLIKVFGRRYNIKHLPNR